MRRKDWADHEADRFHDMLLDGLEYEEVIEEIAKSLRKAAAEFKDEPVTGPVGEFPKKD